MSFGGVEISPEVESLYNEINNSNTNKYATFKTENRKVVVDVKGDPKATKTKEEDKVCFQEMVNHLQSEPRYGLYDFGFTTTSGRQIDKLAFIYWNPDGGNIIKKMDYANTKDTVKKAFGGISTEFEPKKKEDMSYDDYSSAVERIA